MLDRTQELPIHPRTGLRAVGIVNGRPVWPIMGGSEPAPAPTPAPEPSMTKYVPPASQEEFDAIFEKRLARERTKLSSQYSDYEDLKTKAARADELENELGSEADKAAKKARDEERAKANSEFVPRVVKAEFKAAAKGVLTDDQLTALLEDLDLSKYVTDKGDADEEKIAKKVAAFAPAAGTGTKTPPRQLGQGAQPPSNVKPGDQGRAMAEKRFGNKKK